MPTDTAPGTADFDTEMVPPLEEDDFSHQAPSNTIADSRPLAGSTEVITMPSSVVKFMEQMSSQLDILTQVTEVAVLLTGDKLRVCCPVR